MRYSREQANTLWIVLLVSFKLAILYDGRLLDLQQFAQAIPVLKLFLLVLIMPFLELTLLLTLSSYAGWQTTMFIVIVTALLGSYMLRRQGLRVWGEVMNEIRQGRVPSSSLFDGALIIAAGAMVLTPGLITDAIGLSLLVPGVRRHVKAWLAKRVQVKWQTTVQTPQGTTVRSSEDNADVIDSYVVNPPIEE